MAMASLPLTANVLEMTILPTRRQWEEGGTNVDL
jgi:hypothetical protein